MFGVVFSDNGRNNAQGDRRKHQDCAGVCLKEKENE